MEGFEILSNTPAEAGSSAEAFYRARVKQTGQLVMLKKMKQPDPEIGGYYAVAMLHELQVHQKLKLNDSHYVIALFDPPVVEEFNDGDGEAINSYLVFEHLATDLDNVIHGAGDQLFVPEFNTMRLLYQVCKGIDELHKSEVLHLNLKPKKIYVNEEGLVARIGGLESAYSYNFPCHTNRTRDLVGTLCYTTPEVLLGGDYCHTVDVWSIGCIFAEMISGHVLFPAGDNDPPEDQLKSIIRVLGTPTEQLWPGVTTLPNWRNDVEGFEAEEMANHFPTLNVAGRDLLSKMLQYNPTKRISAQAALEHSYFDRVERSQYI